MIGKEELTAAAGRLRERLGAVREHQRSVWLGEGVGLLLAVVVPSLGMAMVLDNLVHLHIAVRLVLLAGLVAGAVLLVRRVARMLRETLTPEQLAVKVERRFPQVDNRLINSLLLAREDDEESFELVRNVIEEGSADASQLDLRAAVPKRKMQVLLGAAGVAVLLMAFYAAMYPEYFTNALARLLVPFASPDALTRTRIVDVMPKDQNVLAGGDITIEVQLDGRIPDSAEVVYEPDDDEMQVAAMHKGDTPEAFKCLMADLGRSFTYRVTAGDAKSDKYRITVHHRPVVSEMNITVTPPEYAGLKPVQQKSGTIKALPGSAVAIEGLCSKPIAKASLVMSTSGPQPMSVQGETTVHGSFKVTGDATYRIELTDTAGFQNKPVEHDIEVMVDEPPDIQLSSPPAAVVVKPDDSIPFQFTVSDRYGVQSVAIVQVTKDADGKTHDTVIEEWKAPDKTVKTVPGNHPLAVSRLKIKPGESGVLQVVASDWNDVTGPGIARSRQIVVTVMLPKEAKADDQEAMKQAALELAQIIQKQRTNLMMGREMKTSELREPGAIAKGTKLAESTALQEEIRDATSKLLAKMDEKLPMRSVLQMLYENEMVGAVRQLRAVSGAAKPIEALEPALDTERVILERLTGRGEQLRRAVDMAAVRDVFSALEELIRHEKEIRSNTDGAIKAGAAGPNAPLADRQDKLAGQVVAFKELLLEHAKSIAQSDVEMAKRFDEGAKMVDSRAIRANMLLAAEKLSKGELPATLPIEDKIIADLEAVGEFIREPIAAAAARKLEQLKEVVQDGKDKAEKLSKLQAAVKEISEELERSKDLTGDEAKKMQQTADELQDLREKMADVIEQMAKDLSLFPEIPAANELVQEAREVFEDIKQAAGSESRPVEEIAVDRDEGMLAAIDKVKERFADMEMWMMDRPDAEAWKQEGWDVAEIPQIPLVDLPEQLEDIVGDLVDQQEELNEQANDSSSNATIPDTPMGWDIGDGPLNSYGAKGKSGNEKPNSNEMAGRSGAGREGNANGEMVEGKAKDLEGTETKARRTTDPFQKGQVEEENPNSQAKATGGGKQSGVGGEGGLAGAAPPRNELNMRELERRQRELRREAESLYSKASLMYLPTGELDEAVLLMQKAEQQARDGDLSGFSETQRRIAHALQNTQRMIEGKGAVKMDPRSKLPMEMREEMYNARDEAIPAEFEKLVAEYYKAIAAGAVK